MAPSKRRKRSAATEPISADASSGVQTRRSASVQCDLPDARDADLDAEPEELLCPITRTMFRDPVMVFDSGHTYERSAVLAHFRRNGATDPLTRRALSSTKVMTIWALRNVVQAWLDRHPDVTPDGWDSRELLEPSKDDETRTFDDEDDVGVLRTWRAMCPELQERWPEAARPEHWEGVTMENGRVVKLELEDFDLTGVVPAELGRLTAVRELNVSRNALTLLPAEIGQLTSLVKLSLSGNRLTSVPAEIGRLTSLQELNLGDNRLTSVPAEIGQLTSLRVLYLRHNRLTSEPAAIRELRAAGCNVRMDDGLTVDDEGDVGVLRTWRAMCPELQGMWPEDEQPEYWEGVTMENGRVVKLELEDCDLTGSLPAEIGRLTALRHLNVICNELTSVPAEIGQLTALRELYLGNNWLTSVPVEIGQLTALRELNLNSNQLTSVPAEIGQLTSLEELRLYGNRLTSVPEEIGQLTSLTVLYLGNNRLTSVPAEIGQLTALRELRLDSNRLTSVPAEIGQLTSLRELDLSGNQLTSVPAEIGQLTLLTELFLQFNQLTSVPEEIGQLMSLEGLNLGDNRLTSVPAEIGLLRALRVLWLDDNQLTSVPAAIRELRATGCGVDLDYGVTVDE